MAERKVVAIVKSSSGTGQYHVAVLPHVMPVGNTREEWQCGCKGWTSHTPRRDCKHITATKKVMEDTSLHNSDIMLTSDGHRYRQIKTQKKILQESGRLPPDPPPAGPPTKPSTVRDRPARRFGK